jgi:hypothetical protein
MDALGLILGIPTALTFAYLITQVIVRLTAEPERPELFPFGDFVNLPEEAVTPGSRAGGGRKLFPSATETRNKNAIARHDGGSL